MADHPFVQVGCWFLRRRNFLKYKKFGPSSQHTRRSMKLSQGFTVPIVLLCEPATILSWKRKQTCASMNCCIAFALRFSTGCTKPPKTCQGCRLRRSPKSYVFPKSHWHREMSFSSSSLRDDSRVVSCLNGLASGASRMEACPTLPPMEPREKEIITQSSTLPCTCSTMHQHT